MSYLKKDGTHRQRFVWLLASAPDQVRNMFVVPSI